MDHLRITNYWNTSLLGANHMTDKRVRDLTQYLIDNNLQLGEMQEAGAEYQDYIMVRDNPRVLAFSQGTWWRDQNNNMIRISTMLCSHAHNLMHWLERNYLRYLESLYDAAVAGDAPIGVLDKLMQEMGDPNVGRTQLYRAVKARADEDDPRAFWSVG